MLPDPALIADLQGTGIPSMITPKQKKRSVIVRTVGPVKPERATKDVMAFKQAADNYVLKATATKKSANSAMMALGIQDAKGKLTKTYRP
ncbi:MAG TPA: hypothetical protein VGM42_06735 [Rhodopila sp.]